MPPCRSGEPSQQDNFSNNNHTSAYTISHTKYRTISVQKMSKKVKKKTSPTFDTAIIKEGFTMSAHCKNCVPNRSSDNNYAQQADSTYMHT